MIERLKCRMHSAHNKVRKYCRLWLPFWSYVFVGVVVISPFVMGEGKHETENLSVFGLSPELVKLGFYGLLCVCVALLIRAIRQVDGNQNALFANQRELTRVITQIVTAHNINHGGQGIEPPTIVGNEGKE